MRATRIGPHIFGNKNAYFNAASNRSLLLEMWESLGLFVVNTGFDLPVEKQVTVYTVGSSPAATLNSTNFGQIDFLLVGKGWWHKILSVASCMDISLASHHLPVVAEIDVEFHELLPQQLVTHGVICLNVGVLARHLVLRHPSMNACYNVIVQMGPPMKYVLPWRRRFSNALSFVCIKPNDKRANPGQAAAHCIY